MYKPIKEYGVDEVGVWLKCIGLDSYEKAFKENSVDGPFLLTLNSDDLTGDLGLTAAEANKLQQKLKFTKELGSGGGGEASAERVKQLEAENAKLRKELKELKEIESALTAPPKSAPAPAHAPPPQHREPGVIGGAARGAAGGAVKGAIAGAILPGMSAADGAAAGAAVGATTGGLRAAGRRRGHRMDYL